MSGKNLSKNSNKNSIPSSQKNSIPSSQKNSIPSSQKNSIPSSQKNSIPSSLEEPLTMLDSVDSLMKSTVNVLPPKASDSGENTNASLPKASESVEKTNAPVPKANSETVLLTTKSNVVPTVSYCTTVFNRFWQLKQVVKHNLTIINNYQPAEWIIVDFGGKDSQEISEWLLQNCAKSLEKGTLKYFRRNPNLPEFVWNVSQAKNVAHRLAGGQILVNLDGDNYLQKQDPQIVRELFLKNPNLLLHQTWNNFLIHYYIRSIGRGRSIVYREFLPNFSGSNGRISMARQHFLDLGGYDEEMLFMGFQDTDLLARGVLAGLKYLVSEPIVGGAQQNVNFSRSNSSETNTGRILRVANRSRTRIRRRNDSSSQANDGVDSNSDFKDRPTNSYGTPRPFRSVVRLGPFSSTRTLGPFSAFKPVFTPFKGDSSDSISNQRARPYKNNQVNSWKEAEHHNRSLSQRKIRQGKLKVNLNGFQVSLDDYM